MTLGNLPPDDELPLAAIHHIGVAVERTIRAHEERCPARAGTSPPVSITQPFSIAGVQLAAIPYPDLSIPDASLARMVELLDAHPFLAIQSLAAKFEYPAALVERELPLYRARYRRWITFQTVALAG